MADDPDTIDAPGDTRGSTASQHFRALMEHPRASNPEYTLAPRRISGSGWRPDIGDIILHVVGDGILVAVLVMHLLGYY